MLVPPDISPPRSLRASRTALKALPPLTEEGVRAVEKVRIGEGVAAGEGVRAEERVGAARLAPGRADEGEAPFVAEGGRGSEGEGELQLVSEGAAVGCEWVGREGGDSLVEVWGKEGGIVGR